MRLRGMGSAVARRDGGGGKPTHGHVVAMTKLRATATDRRAKL
jgi:hypothetical protein